MATTVVRLAISIIRRTRANRTACSSVGSGFSVWLMQGSLNQGSSDQGASGSAERLEVKVEGSEGSPRLDRVLAARLSELSRSRLKALIVAGQVSVGKASGGTAP